EAPSAGPEDRRRRCFPVLQFLKSSLLLGTFLLGFTFPAWPEGYTDERPQVFVSVYDDAGVSATVLIQAEQRAAKIFDEAGVDVIWQNCSSSRNHASSRDHARSRNHVGPDALVQAGEQSSPGVWRSAEQRSLEAVDQPNRAALRPTGRPDSPAPARSESECATLEWPTRLAVRILPRSLRSTSEVFGVSFLSTEGTGCYSDVFLEWAMELHADWKVSLPDILGGVMAHELGHLLLGSNSHSRAGIMRAHWQGEELNLLSRGNLRFTSEQAEHMRGKLNRVRPAAALTARSSF
ncbi:MAG: hypothetical protein ACRD3W_11710, partial [Terriglobales bacterium]